MQLQGFQHLYTLSSLKRPVNDVAVGLLRALRMDFQFEPSYQQRYVFFCNLVAGNVRTI